MGLQTKFNLTMLSAFLIGLALTALLSQRILQENAHQEVLQNARIMIESAAAVRSYTAQEIHPLLINRIEQEFLPQTVSAYAASKNFKALQEKLPEYSYKEAALNPTNPNDRAADWEADIIQAFRNNPSQQELIIERKTPVGPMLHLARPLQIKYEGCLNCHGKPENAPKTMTQEYGMANGFGWKMDEIVGAQIVSLPMKVQLERAQGAFNAFMVACVAIFALVFLLVNIALRYLVIKPMKEMSKIANEVSLGKLDTAEYVKKGHDEIASLSQSFNRMRRSMQSAIKLLEDQ